MQGEGEMNVKTEEEECIDIKQEDGIYIEEEGEEDIDTIEGDVDVKEESCKDSLQVPPGSSSEMFSTPSDGTCDVSNTAVEWDVVVIEERSIAVNEEVLTRIKQEEIPEDISFPDIKTEPHESCTDYLQVLPGSSNETFPTSSDGTCDVSNTTVEQDVVVIEERSIAVNEDGPTGIKQEEIPEDISFPDIKTEPHENCVDLRSGELGFCATSSEIGNELVRVQVEGAAEVTGGENQEPITSSLTDAGGTRNEQLHAQTSEHRYSCNVCSKAFNFEGDLMRHKCSHGGERPYCCNVCSKTFKSKSVLIRHKRLHSGERPYCCDVCSKAFTQKGSLVSHKLLHSGERPYCCDVCSKTFKSKSDLIRHKRLHSGERPYCCDVCSKAFTEKGSLVSHKRLHSVERPYCCDVCSKTFKSKSDVVRHKRSHSDERPYSCDLCSKTYKAKGALIRHKRLHSGERPYRCDVCSETFTSKIRFSAHQLIQRHSL